MRVEPLLEKAKVVMLMGFDNFFIVFQVMQDIGIHMMRFDRLGLSI